MNIFHHCALLTRFPFDYEPNAWHNFLNANCYEYLLNFKNSSQISLTVGKIIGKDFQLYQSNSDLLKILTEELNFLGFSLEKANNYSDIPINKMKFFVSRSACGDYHFYRLDSNGKWSHKFSYFEPSNLDFSGHIITLPEQACNTDINLGYYLLGLQNR